MILKNIFWDRKYLKIFDENFISNPTFLIFQIGFQLKFSSKISRYFRTQKIFFQNHLSPWIFYGISKIRMQNEATMLYYPLASIRQRFRPQRLLHRAAQRPPERSAGFVSQITCFEELPDLRNSRNDKEYVTHIWSRSQWHVMDCNISEQKSPLRRGGLWLARLRYGIGLLGEVTRRRWVCHIRSWASETQ